jgi:Ser/Thr protein kinase RdoA (MazF antagonist)
MLDVARVATEFGLGPVLGAEPLPGGHRDVTRLTTGRGTFVVKPGYQSAELELYERVARALDQAGIRQARPLRTTGGTLVSASGHAVQEFLPGRICLPPSAAQTIAVMRHLTGYHAALSQIPDTGPGPEPTVWTRVAGARYLVTELPGLLRRHAPPGRAGDRDVATALGHLERGLPGLGGLPRQLVHGDIGPDNVLMDGDQVVSVIDFTPHRQPVLFAVAGAVYWYHVHGQDEPDLDAIAASLAAHQPWSAAERAAWPAMLAREALRRFATPFAVAAQQPQQPQQQPAPWPQARYQAVVSIVRCWPRLPALLPP